jgi:hypothetical protein
MYDKRQSRPEDSPTLKVRYVSRPIGKKSFFFRLFLPDPTPTSLLPGAISTDEGFNFLGVTIRHSPTPQSSRMGYEL